MKKVLLSLILAGSLGLGSQVAQAQSKVGHVNLGEIILLMPETKTADGELQKFGESLESQMKTMGAEYQAKLNDYQSKKESMAEAIRTTKEKEIIDLQQRIQEFQSTAQEGVQRKKEELYAPILKRADEAVKAVAKEQGYNYIIDSSLGVLLVVSEDSDLGQAVRKRLGIPATAKLPEQGRPAGGAGMDMRK